MIKIRVKDTAAILKEYQMPYATRRSMARLLQQTVLAETYEQIIVLANRNLHTSKQQYIDGLVMNTNSIDLEGWLPNAIESGVSGFDMKEYFAKSSKVKFNKKGGWYLTIPFRVYTPGGGDYRNQMSWQIYRAVRAGRKYDAGTAGSRGGFTDLATGRVWDSYENKTPILAGIKQTIGANGRSTYSTFRRVSSNSNPNSWIHSGIMAHNFIDKAWANIDVDRIINDVLS